MTSKLTGEQLIERGVGLVAKGMFRLGDKSGENNPKGAHDSGMTAVPVIREMAFDFLRKAKSGT